MDPLSVAELRAASIRRSWPPSSCTGRRRAPAVRSLPGRFRSEVMLRGAPLKGKNDRAGPQQVLFPGLAGGDRSARPRWAASRRRPNDQQPRRKSDVAVRDTIRNYDPDRARIMDKMFVFDDLVKLDDRSVQLVLPGVVSDATSRRGGSMEVRDKILAMSMGRRVAARGPGRPRDACPGKRSKGNPKGWCVPAKKADHHPAVGDSFQRHELALHPFRGDTSARGGAVAFGPWTRAAEKTAQPRGPGHPGAPAGAQAAHGGAGMARAPASASGFHSLSPPDPDAPRRGDSMVRMSKPTRGAPPQPAVEGNNSPCWNGPGPRAWGPRAAGPSAVAKPWMTMSPARGRGARAPAGPGCRLQALQTVGGTAHLACTLPPRGSQGCGRPGLLPGCAGLAAGRRRPPRPPCA
ncbi:flagellar motor switch protein FliG [Trichonephila inaurata madagascariensis]|uniref:Flagellar motor switch protein FliG n=1 Tax=Trichonephila inaurata madagascariensis TaxID=2747483 RepID=A0A8X6YTZ0_9ARAC|nr:flagellar motor switch protein FliG [Trichonephila inaurata madagascariensis]